MLEFRHLRYFIAVAEALNFSRAAEALGTAQPSLSQQIRALEREIGVELFARGKRRIELTAAGKEFLIDARRLVAGLGEAVAHAREAGRGMRGELRVGYTASAMMSSLPAAIRAYRADRPDVRIALRSLEPGLILDALRRRELDVGVLLEQRDRSRLAEIDVRRIGSLALAAVVPEGHRLAHRRAIALEEIGREPLIVFSRRLGDIHEVVLALCRERGFVPARIEEADRVEAILGLVAAGEGVSVVPRVYETLGFRGVAFTALRPAPQPFAMVVARRSGAQSELAAAFATVCERIGGPGASRLARRNRGEP